jgi:DNA-3-methyladenine glycosylase II
MRAAIRHLKKADPILAAIIGAVGPFRLVTHEPTFETLTRSIVYQQVSGRAAASIFAKLSAAVGRSFSARALLRLTPEELRACGLSAQKIVYVRDLAERVVKRQLDFKKLPAMTNDEIIETLTQVKGVGVWTAHMFLIFALQRPDVFPIGDLGVQNAIRRAYQLQGAPKPADLLRISQRWHPYRSVAAWYLWRSLEGAAALGDK